MKKLLSTAIFLVIGFATVAAYAQERKSILDDQPEVRRRVMFLPARFEVTPEIGMTYLQDFKHNLLVGLRAEYHIIEALSIGVFFDYAVYAWHTQLTNEIESTLPERLNPNTTVDPSPSKQVMKSALDTLMFKAGAYLAYTPWFGKLSLFGKLFVKFDLHILAGVGFAMFKEGHIDDAYRDPEGLGQGQLYIYYEDNYKNGGFKVGPLWGFGLRFWVLKYLALAFTMRTLHIKRNSAGFDKTGDTRPGYDDVVVVSKKDESWEMLMSFTIGVSFFFPMNAPRSK
ncbi:MAG: outer membrane beta-barrel domain-containing protein [bacterium]